MPQNHMKILLADNSEILALARNLADSVLREFFTPQQITPYVAIELKTDKLWVIDIDGAVTATAVLREIAGRPQIRELRLFTVAKAWRRAGLGTFLFKHLKNHAAQNGIKHLLIKLDSRLINACLFFEKEAFMRTGQENAAGEYIAALAVNPAECAPSRE